MLPCIKIRAFLSHLFLYSCLKSLLMFRDKESVFCKWFELNHASSLPIFQSITIVDVYTIPFTSFYSAYHLSIDFNSPSILSHFSQFPSFPCLLIHPIIHHQLFHKNVPSSFIVCPLKHATSQTRVHSRKDVWKDRTAACYQSFAKQIWFITLLESMTYLGISLGSTESKGIGLMDGSEERSVCHLSYRFLSTFPIHSRYLHLSQLLFGRSTQY